MAPEPPEPPRPDRARTWFGDNRRWVITAIAISVSLGIWLFGWWSDQREIEQARDELRELGVTEEQIDEIDDLAGDLDRSDWDLNDGTLTDSEIVGVREVFEILVAEGAFDGLTDEDLRTLGQGYCDAVTGSDIESGLGSFLIAATTRHDLDPEVLVTVAGGAAGAICLDDLEDAMARFEEP